MLTHTGRSLVFVLVAIVAICGVTWKLTQADARVPLAEVRAEAPSPAQPVGSTSPTHDVARLDREAASSTPAIGESSRAQGDQPMDRAAFEAHLVDFISEHFMAEQKDVTAHDALSTKTAAADQYINPDGKTPNDAQLLEIAAIFRKYDDASKAVNQQERSLCGTALLQAVAIGQYTASEPNRPMTVTTPEGFKQAKEQIGRQRDGLQKAQEDLTRRLGRPMQDWAYSVLATQAPDGNGYATMVYFTAGQAPELFACRRELANGLRDRHDELKRYFAGLRR